MTTSHPAPVPQQTQPSQQATMLTSAVLFLSLLGAVLGYDSETKFWMPNTNFGNPKNWNLNRVPCEMDRVVFPSGLDLGIALPEGQTALRELVLPMNGEIILPLNGVMELGGGRQEASKCPGEDIAFTRSGVKAWLDPANWRAEPQEGALGVGTAPHFDAIPCDHDLVQFEAGASVKIQLPEVDVVVGKVKFGDKVLTSSEWITWLNSDTGFRQFVGRWDDRATALVVQPPSDVPCPDKAGCVCHRGNPQRLLEHICRFERPRCPPPACYSPVTPQGHCCQICGSVIAFKHDAAFDLAFLQRLLMDYLRGGKNSNILIHAKKTAFEKDSVQVVIAEKGTYQGTSGPLANQIADDILRDMELGVKKVTVSSSGPMILGSKLMAAVKTTFSTFVAVLLFLAITFYVFVVYRKGLPFGAANYQLFQFARFENTPGDEDGVLAIGNESGLQPPPELDDEGPSKSFDNPMYGNAPGVAAEARAREDEGSAGSHHYPIYSELKKRVEATNDDKEEETDTDDDSDASDGDSQAMVEKPEEETAFQDILFDKAE